MDGKLAIEEHFSTPMNDGLWDARGEKGRNGAAYADAVAWRLLDTDACLAEMDRSGIALCVRSLTSPGIQSIVDPGAAIRVARDANDHAAAFVRAHPDRLAAFAAVPLQDPEAAADELERAVVELGLKGALINGYSSLGPDERVQYLDEPPVRAFWSRVATLKVPVYLHPREPLPSQWRALLGYPELVGSAWGFGYETASHAIRLMLSGLFDEYPDVQVILGHLGEGLPFMLSRLQHRLDAQREGRKGSAARHRPSHYFARNFHITTSGHFHTLPLLATIQQIGADRVMFSADYPFEQMDAAARWFDELQIDLDLKRKLGRDNANRLLGLGLPDLPQSMVAGCGA